jgi:hypothetical protein
MQHALSIALSTSCVSAYALWDSGRRHNTSGMRLSLPILNTVLQMETVPLAVLGDPDQLLSAMAQVLQLQTSSHARFEIVQATHLVYLC